MNLTKKTEFYPLWRAGMLGNKPRIWHTLDDLQRSGYRGELTIRSVASAGGTTKYRVPYEEAVRLSFSWPCAHNFNESMPDERLLLQGEVMETWRGYYLASDRTPGLKMNEARQRFVFEEGMVALAKMRTFLWPSSYDDVTDLLDLYPHHVVEFSAYDMAVGDQRHRNTIIWEVRYY